MAYVTDNQNAVHAVFPMATKAIGSSNYFTNARPHTLCLIYGNTETKDVSLVILTVDPKDLPPITSPQVDETFFTQKNVIDAIVEQGQAIDPHKSPLWKDVPKDSILWQAITKAGNALAIFIYEEETGVEPQVVKTMRALPVIVPDATGMSNG